MCGSRVTSKLDVGFDGGFLGELAIKVNRSQRTFRKSQTKILFKPGEVIRHVEFGAIWQANRIGWRKALDFWSPDWQFGKKLFVESSRLPTGVQTQSRFKGVAKVCEVGYTTTEARVPLKDTHV